MRPFPAIPVRLLVGAGLVALLAACASSGSGGGSPTLPPSAVPSTPSDPSAPTSPSPSVSLAPGSGQASPGEPIAGDRLTGVLGADSIEGGCAYLEVDGTRYEVIYPDGWKLSVSPLELRNPDGAVVARGGDRLTVVGEEATDMGSFCMIGPIFRAEAVELAGSD